MTRHFQKLGKPTAKNGLFNQRMKYFFTKLISNGKGKVYLVQKLRSFETKYWEVGRHESGIEKKKSKGYSEHFPFRLPIKAVSGTKSVVNVHHTIE